MPSTFFASPGRATTDQLNQAREILGAESQIRALLEAIPLPVAILNPQRQILAANAVLIDLLGGSAAPDLNQRLGEALGCVHFIENPSACVTGTACTQCGFGVAVFGSQLMDAVVRRECHFSAAGGHGKQADFEVIASPLPLAGQALTMVLLRDVSEVRRRSAIERLFLHDLLNSASGLRVLARLLETEAIGGTNRDECKVLFSNLSNNLIDDITHQRKLLQAERGELGLQVETIHVKAFLENLIRVCTATVGGRDRSLLLGPIPDELVETDGVLLRRVLINLIKNALEATPSGGTVTVRCQAPDDDIEFLVHNPGLMQQSIQSQIFQRTFSTKDGSGRGLGTYSVKLFVESYMGGSVRFDTDPLEGTVFSFRIPKVCSLTHGGARTPPSTVYQ